MRYPNKNYGHYKQRRRFDNRIRAFVYNDRS